MSGLAEFLEARIAEDEEAARDAHYEGQHWLTEEEGVYRWPDDELVHMADRTRDARHIARWDPARVLAECEAKRRLIAFAYDADAIIDGERGCCHSGEAIQAGQCPYMRPDDNEGVRILAAVYASHPDYDPSWRV